MPVLNRAVVSSRFDSPLVQQHQADASPGDEEDLELESCWSLSDGCVCAFLYWCRPLGFPTHSSTRTVWEGSRPIINNALRVPLQSSH